MSQTRIAPTLCITVAAALALVTPAQARTIEPNTTADVRADDGRCSLREAVTASYERLPSGAAGGECPAGEGGDTIALGAARYELAGAAGDDNNLSGDIDILGSLTIVGRGASDTIIDVRGLDRVIEIGQNNPGTVAVTIDAIQVTGGKAPAGAGRPPSTGPGSVTGDTGGSGAGGGGILNRATLTLRNSAVTGNRAGTGGRGGNANAASGTLGGNPGSAGTGGRGGAGGDGGGFRSDGKLLAIENSTITGNAAGDGGAGGVGFGGDGAAGSGSAGGEKAGAGTGGRGGAGGRGGGIVSDQRLNVVDSVVATNASGAGGAGSTGVGGFGGRGGSDYTPGGDGAGGTGGRGGLAGYGGGIDAEADADIRRTLIAGNTAATGGAGGNGVGGGGGSTGMLPGGDGGAGGAGAGGAGGSGASGAGILTAVPSTVENTTVTANLAGDGGEAGDALGGAGGTGAKRGRGADALAGNGGDGGGGGGVAQVKGGTLSHVTIHENAVGGGGEAGDAASGAGQPAGRSEPGLKGPRGGVAAIWPFPGTTTTLRNSIVASNFGGNCTGTVTDGGHNVTFGDASCPGTQADPRLGALQDNGGPTPTHAIAPESPAFDAVPATDAECAATDQRSVARPHGPACDSGAFEFRPAPPPGDQPRSDGPGGDRSGRDTVAPLFGSASMTAKVFAVDRRGTAEAAVARRAKRGTTFRYSLSEPARVVFTIERVAAGRRVGGKCRQPTRRSRGAKACKRYVRAGRFAVASRSGANSHRFSGRVGRRALIPGRYRATLVAADDAGNRSKPRRLPFRVARR